MFALNSNGNKDDRSTVFSENDSDETANANAADSVSIPDSFSSFKESEFAGIIQKAQKELDSLFSESVLQSLLDSRPSDSEIERSTNADVFVAVELGKTRISRQDSDAIQKGTIVSFPQNDEGIVQLYYQNRRVASGVLIVDNGKLAIKIKQIFPF